MPETVKNWNDIINNLNQFKRIIDNKNNKAFERLTNFSHWYYFPKENLFAPNKFLRYKNTTLENYEGIGYGNSSDPTLTKYFKEVEKKSNEYKSLFFKLEEFVQKIGKKLNASIEIYIPKNDIHIYTEQNKDEFIYSEDERKYFEGKMSESTRNISKRNSEARKKCLEHYFPSGEHYNCKICGFDFEEKYGEIGKRYIEVHHIISHTVTSKKFGEHEINPIKNLIPVCSNCHSIIHRSKIPLEIEEMEKIIKKQ